MPKVLIIEDRRENIVFIANNILRPMGCGVVTARDGEMGLQKAIEESPDLIITDIKLPKMSGLDVLERLNDREIYIPAIVMTFHGNEKTAVRALRLGAVDYLIKPFDIKEMQNAITRAFRIPATTVQVQAPTPTPTPMKSVSNRADDGRVQELEEQLALAQTELVKREVELEEVKKKAANLVNKVDMAEVAQRAASWEEDNARLNNTLAHAKFALSKSQHRTHAVEEAMLAQKNQIIKYQREIKRLAREMRNISEAMRLMSQDMDQQLKRLGVLMPENESERQ